PPSSPLFPYTTLFRSPVGMRRAVGHRGRARPALLAPVAGQHECVVLEIEAAIGPDQLGAIVPTVGGPRQQNLGAGVGKREMHGGDRKSTRLNSSHDQI